MSENAHAETWTGEIIMQDGRLPDLKAWRRGFREVVGEAFTIRGVEVTVDGRLVEVEKEGRLALEVPGGKDVLRLVPLRGKVQWDPARERAQEPTAGERRAFEELEATWTGQPRRVRIVGPLGEAKGPDPPTLEVREVVSRR